MNSDTSGQASDGLAHGKAGEGTHQRRTSLRTVMKTIARRFHSVLTLRLAPVGNRNGPEVSNPTANRGRARRGKNKRVCKVTRVPRGADVGRDEAMTPASRRVVMNRRVGLPVFCAALQFGTASGCWSQATVGCNLGA